MAVSTAIYGYPPPSSMMARLARGSHPSPVGGSIALHRRRRTRLEQDQLARQGLSFPPGFTYYREPGNYHGVAEAEDRFHWRYLTPDQDDPAYLRFMARACAGRIATAFTMCDDLGPILKHFGARGRRWRERFPVLFCRRRYVLLKSVYANLHLA